MREELQVLSAFNLGPVCLVHNSFLSREGAETVYTSRMEDAEIEVLLELGASKKLLTVSSTDLLAKVQIELVKAFGDVVALVPLSKSPSDVLSTSSSKELYILQRYSKKWDTFVDVREVAEVKDGDKLTAVVFNPRPASTLTASQSVSRS